MHLISVVSAVFILSSVTPAVAQEWADFVSREDGFKVNFPAARMYATTYRSEYGAASRSRLFVRAARLTP